MSRVELSHQLVSEAGEYWCSCGRELPGVGAGDDTVWVLHLGSAWIKWASEDTRDETEKARLADLALELDMSAAAGMIPSDGYHAPVDPEGP